MLAAAMPAERLIADSRRSPLPESIAILARRIRDLHSLHSLCQEKTVCIRLGLDQQATVLPCMDGLFSAAEQLPTDTSMVVRRIDVDAMQQQGSLSFR